MEIRDVSGTLELPCFVCKIAVHHPNAIVGLHRDDIRVYHPYCTAGAHQFLHTQVDRTISLGAFLGELTAAAGSR